MTTLKTNVSAQALLSRSNLLLLIALWLGSSAIVHFAYSPYLHWEVETLIDLSIGCAIGIWLCPGILKHSHWQFRPSTVYLPLAIGLAIQMLLVYSVSQTRNKSGYWIGLVEVIGGPILEEIFSRGILLSSLVNARPHQKIVPVLAVSAFMALFHHWFWIAFFQQVLLCFAFLRPHSSLGRSTFVHSAMNTVSFLARTV